MFVKRKRGLLTQRFKYETSNIAFCCVKPFEGFEVGRIYKPFAYTAEFTTYTEFALFDNNGEVFYMEDKLVRQGYFKVMLHGNLYINSFAQEESEAIKFIEYENRYWKKYATADELVM
jgi:hypothetical protein